MLLDATDSGYRIEHHHVDYNYPAVIAAIEGSRHPAGAYMTHQFQRKPAP